MFRKLFYFELHDLKKSGILVEQSSNGGLAQLGERLPYKQRVSGSSPLASTIVLER